MLTFTLSSLIPHCHCLPFLAWSVSLRHASSFTSLIFISDTILLITLCLSRSPPSFCLSSPDFSLLHLWHHSTGTNPYSQGVHLQTASSSPPLPSLPPSSDCHPSPPPSNPVLWRAGGNLLTKKSLCSLHPLSPRLLRGHEQRLAGTVVSVLVPFKMGSLKICFGACDLCYLNSTVRNPPLPTVYFLCPLIQTGRQGIACCYSINQKNTNRKKQLSYQLSFSKHSSLKIYRRSHWRLHTLYFCCRMVQTILSSFEFC